MSGEGRRMGVGEALERLGRSRFRGRFHLDEAERRKVAEAGLETIRRHAAELMAPRVFAAFPANDGRQTPMRGHPVFKAMHATATCCRGCMEKWWRVRRGVALDGAQQEKAVNLVMAWIEREVGGRCAQCSATSIQQPTANG